MRKTTLFVLLGAVCWACGRPAAQPEGRATTQTARLAGLVAYDDSRPIDFQEGSVRSESGFRAIEATYSTLSGRRNAATLVEPTASGPHGAVLFAHWYSPEHHDSHRSQFLPEAERLASRGVVSLLVDTMWSTRDWFETRDPAHDFTSSVEQVKELRRALDVLLSRPGIDRTRVLFVGHDFGAMYGVLAAAVDRRVTGFAFLAGTGAFSDWFLLGRKLQGAEKQAVIDELAVLDPVRSVGALTPIPVFFQFANTDPYVTKASADALVRAAGEPKSARWYDAGHGLNAESRRDLYEWVAARLRTEGRSSPEPVKPVS